MMKKSGSPNSADQSRTVRLPQNRTVVLLRVHRTLGRLQQKLGRQPLPEEIAAEAELRLDEVREALRVGQPEAHLDEIVAGDDDGRTLGDSIADDFGLTRERIRQLKERALGRLRSQDHARVLIDHYQES